MILGADKGASSGYRKSRIERCLGVSGKDTLGKKEGITIMQEIDITQ
jgi:hypothetical protein